MPKLIHALCLLLTAASAQALTTQAFRDNTDITVALSDSNYNRLVVKGDKITQAHFPEGRMAIRNEEDGSLYVMLGSHEPFTLFLTTESGHHFSATVNAESSLGKTIEFVPQTAVTAHLAEVKATPNQSAKPPMGDAIAHLMTSMISKDKPAGFDEKHHYGRVIRLQQGLRLTPKITWQGLQLNGEVMEIYNGGKLPLDLSEAWFADNDVKAVSLSATTLAPKQTALVYRVLERAHG